MDPIVMLLLGFGAFKMLGGSKDQTQTETGGAGSGTESTIKEDLPGAPELTIRRIQKIPVDKVEFTLSAGGFEEKGDHKAKLTAPTMLRAGDYTLMAVTDPKTRPGQKKPDAVVIAVRNKAGKTVIGKRIHINDKEIIDLV